jgi:hypothetical protein
MSQIMIKKKKPKRVYKMEELTKSDIELLIQAASTPPEYFFCFGMAWYKLFALGLIDEDTRVTQDGIMAIRSFQ